MNTTQLRRILKKDTYVRPHLAAVCPHDLLQHHIEQASSKCRTAAIVFNLDPSHLPGSHWVAAFLDFVNGQAEYFDSTGLPPDPACHQLLRNHCPQRPLLHNNRILQEDTMVCGQFCVAFLKLRCRGHSFRQSVQILTFKDNDRAVYDLVRRDIPDLPYKL